MKRFGPLNRDISRVLAAMGHTDSLVIANVILFSQVVFAHATRNAGHQQSVRPGESVAGS